MNEKVFSTHTPYVSRSPRHPDTTDATDNIYGTDGSSLLLSPAVSGDGYGADFSVGVSAAGDDSGTAGDTRVAARLLSATMVRTATGTRRLRLGIQAGERVRATARLTRGGRTLAVRRVSLARGTRVLRLTIPDGVAAGAARLRLALTDDADNAKSYARVVHVHARRE